MGDGGERVQELLDLVDYRRRVTDLYRAVREGEGTRATWERWVAGRDDLFATHPQSALDPAAKTRFRGLSYFAYDPSLRMAAAVAPDVGPAFELAHSSSGSSRIRRVGTATFELADRRCELSMFWFDQYGGGLFLPFRDGTSGSESYGGGRYLLDTAKGADLGVTGDGALVLDFNYAYHPSCFHDPRWSCPLAPPENRLAVPVRGGERLPPRG